MQWSDQFQILTINLLSLEKLVDQGCEADDQELEQLLLRSVGVSLNALQLGLRQAELEQAPLPIVLWSFGLLNLEQLQTVLDWQDAQS